MPPVAGFEVLADLGGGGEVFVVVDAEDPQAAGFLVDLVFAVFGLERPARRGQESAALVAVPSGAPGFGLGGRAFEVLFFDAVLGGHDEAA